MHELRRTLDDKRTEVRQSEMTDVARHERVGARGQRHFQKRPVGLVRQFQAERRRGDTLALRFEKVQEIRDVGRVEAELRTPKNSTVLGQNAVVDEKGDLARQ